MAHAFIGIGSNLGNRTENCIRAISLLKHKGLMVTKQSSFHETEPWGVADQPRFINMAIEIETTLDPQTLLKVLKRIEEEMGRTDAGRWGPRIIDLDILLYDDLTIGSGDLTIPHPLMHEREFVLRPLAEIAPDALHPVLGKRVRDLLILLSSHL